MDLEVRQLEQSSMKLIPDLMMMESETVLTQYIISSWSLVYRNDGNHHFIKQTLVQDNAFKMILELELHYNLYSRGG